MACALVLGVVSDGMLLVLGFCASVLVAGLVLLCGLVAGGVDSALSLGAVVVVVVVVVVDGVVSVGLAFCSAGWPVMLDGCVASEEAGLFGF